MTMEKGFLDTEKGRTRRIGRRSGTDGRHDNPLTESLPPFHLKPYQTFPSHSTPLDHSTTLDLS